MLKEEGKIDDDVICKLMRLRYSGFSVHNGVRVARDDEIRKGSPGTVYYPQYLSLEKTTYHDETGTVVYRSRMSHGKNKKNFQIYMAEEFIAAITKHIPEKSFQNVFFIFSLLWCSI